LFTAHEAHDANYNLKRDAIMEPGQSSNPYQAPTVDVLHPTQSADGVTLIPNGRSVSAGKGVEWISRAWQLFMRAPLIWIVTFVIFIIIVMALSLVPFLGSVATTVLGPVFSAGFVFAADRLRRGENFDVGHMFAGFQQQTTPLLILGAIWLGISLLMVAILAFMFAASLGVSGFFGAAMGGDPDAFANQIAAGGMALILQVALILLVAFGISIPLVMAYWFAPALVMLHNMSPIEAMKASFKGCLKNILPFLLYGLVFLVLFIIAAIPLMLGFLVVAPLTIVSIYTSYRDIFVGDDD
jgi:uncharacterized membrane protein